MIFSILRCFMCIPLIWVFPQFFKLVCLELKIVFLLKTELNERVFRFAVDGGWSNWENYGPCSKTCGSGSRTRTRTCNDPAPAEGGKPCVGLGSETQTCNVKACPGIYAHFKVLMKDCNLNMLDIHFFF